MTTTGVHRSQDFRMTTAAFTYQRAHVGQRILDNPLLLNPPRHFVDYSHKILQTNRARQESQNAKGISCQNGKEETRRTR